MTWKSNTGKFDFAFLIFCAQQFTKNLIFTNITGQKIPHRWRVHFMYADSFVQKWSASTIHCQAGKETKSISNHFFVVLTEMNHFFWFLYGIYQTNFSPKCWWILVDINWATKRQGKDHHCSPPLRWNIIIVNYLF